MQAYTFLPRVILILPSSTYPNSSPSCGKSSADEAPGRSSRIMGSIMFFCAFGIIHFSVIPSSRFSMKSSALNTTRSSSSFLKNSARSVPSAARMSQSVAMEGDVISFSSCDIYPFVSSHLSASSACERLSCCLSLFILLPISIKESPLQVNKPFNNSKHGIKRRV